MLYASKLSNLGPINCSDHINHLGNRVNIAPVCFHRKKTWRFTAKSIIDRLGLLRNWQISLNVAGVDLKERWHLLADSHVSTINAELSVEIRIRLLHILRFVELCCQVDCACADDARFLTLFDFYRVLTLPQLKLLLWTWMNRLFSVISVVLASTLNKS